MNDQNYNSALKLSVWEFNLGLHIQESRILWLTKAGMLMRPAGHKAEAEAEARKYFRGRGHSIRGRGQTPCREPRPDTL